jgi:nitrite reductase (NADH) small subunit
MNAVVREWIELCAADEIPPLGARVVRRASGVADVAIFRAGDGSVYALEDRCPHRGGPLSQGIVAGARVTCPLHGWTIELASGEAVAPDTGVVRRYAVRVEGGRVLLEAAAFDLSSASAKPPPCPLSTSRPKR